MNKQCSSDNCDKCFECHKYYSYHSPHYENYYGKRVITITCQFGVAGTYDAETGERLSTI